MARRRRTVPSTQNAALVFTELGLPDTLVSHEVAEMDSHQVTKTANRSVLGTMNDFTYLAEAHRAPKATTDLVELSLRLAQTPCGPLYRSHISPDREIIADCPVTGRSARCRAVDRCGPYWMADDQGGRCHRSWPADVSEGGCAS